MMEKVLVVYGSWTGSTASIAKAIGNGLREKGFMVDVSPPKQAGDLAGYDAVVVGAAVRATRPHGAIMKYLAKHQSELAAKAVAIFAVCMSVAEDTDEGRAQVESYIAALKGAAPGIEPIKTGAFCGMMDFSKLNFMLKAVVKAIKSEEADGRDWEAISAWTAELGDALKAS